MIQLDIEGQPVDMGGQSVRLDKPSGLLEFDALEPTISQQIELANTPPNRKAFGFIHRPEGLSPFKGYQGSLQWRSLNIAQGEFILNKADRQSFGGFFRGDAGDWARVRDRRIADLLAHLNVTIGVAPDSDAPFVIGHDADVVFPPAIGRHRPADTRQGRDRVRIDRSVVLAGRDTRAYDRNVRNATSRSLSDGTQSFANFDPNIEEIVFYNQVQPFAGYGQQLPIKYLPAFKIRHLLDRLAEAIGYKLIVQNADYTLDYAVLFAWRPAERATFELERSYSFFLPEMTLAEFINAVRAMGTAVSIDSQRREIVAVPFDEVANTAPKDLTHIAEPDPEISIAIADGGESAFVFANESQLVPTVRVETGILPAVPAIGAIGYIYSENAVYEAVKTTSSTAEFVSWQYAGPANIRETLLKAIGDVQCIFSPVRAGTQFYFRCEGVSVSDDGSGNVMLGIAFNTLRKEDYLFRIVDPEELGDTTFFIEDIDPSKRQVVLDLPYVAGIETATVEYVNKFDAFGWKTMCELQQETAPYIALYHGEKAVPLGAGTYGYASPTGFDTAYPATSTRITEQDLTMEAILKYRMATAKRIIEQGKLAKYRLQPRAKDLQTSAIAPIAIDGVKLLPKVLSATLGDSIEATLEAYILQGE